MIISLLLAAASPLFKFKEKVLIPYMDQADEDKARLDFYDCGRMTKGVVTGIVAIVPGKYYYRVTVFCSKADIELETVGEARILKE